MANKKKQQDEKETKKKRKSRGGFLWVILILLVLVAILLFLGNGFGFGRGGGEDSGASQSSAGSSESSTPDETNVAQYRTVTVGENGYFYPEGSKALTLEELLSALQADHSDLPVKITDDHASQKAYQELTDALTEQKIPYVEENAN